MDSLSVKFLTFYVIPLHNWNSAKHLEALLWESRVFKVVGMESFSVVEQHWHLVVMLYYCGLLRCSLLNCFKCSLFCWGVIKVRKIWKLSAIFFPFENLTVLRHGCVKLKFWFVWLHWIRSGSAVCVWCW